MHLVQHTELEDEHKAYEREGVETNQEKGGPVTRECKADHKLVGKFKCVPSVFVPQESTGDTSEDEESPKHTESRVKLGVQSNRGR